MKGDAKDFLLSRVGMTLVALPLLVAWGAYLGSRHAGPDSEPRPAPSPSVVVLVDPTGGRTSSTAPAPTIAAATNYRFDVSFRGEGAAELEGRRGRWLPITLPAARHLSANADGYLSARIRGAHGTVSCEVSLDGHVLLHRSGEGEVSCSQPVGTLLDGVALR